jgi:hypothetical protein
MATDSLTTQEIERLDALFAKATPGPWSSDPDGDTTPLYGTLRTGTPQQIADVFSDMKDTDAALIAALHNAWPKIRQSLAAPRISAQPQPVAWMIDAPTDEDAKYYGTRWAEVNEEKLKPWREHGWKITPLVYADAHPSESTASQAPEATEYALNTRHPDCHKAADAFWQYWRETQMSAQISRLQETVQKYQEGTSESASPKSDEARDALWQPTAPKEYAPRTAQMRPCTCGTPSNWCTCPGEAP